MFIFISILAMSLIGFLIHVVFFEKYPLTKQRIVELLLLYQLVFSIGLTSFLAFIGLTLMTDFVASYMGWPSCQFAKLLGNVNLAFGILGVLCIWLRGHFWIATALGFSIWIFADGITHLYELHRQANIQDHNLVIPIVTDFLVPTVVMILLFLHLHYRRQAQGSRLKLKLD
jgi:hypothetical protein